jgi:diguanylate cyclase (GGDEF)-like protein/PAS domain S-box-containing protein
MNMPAEPQAWLAVTPGVADRSNQAVVITGADNRIRWANQAFADFTGHPLASCLGRRPGAVLPFVRQDRNARQPLLAAVAAREAARVRICREQVPGRPQWVDIDLQPLHSPSGHFDGYVAVLGDISQAVSQHAQAQALLQILPVGVVTLDTEMRVVQANASAARVFGLSLAQMAGLRLCSEYLDTLHEDGSPMPPQARPAVLTLQDGQSRHGQVHGLRMPDGSRRWLQASTVAQRDLEGRITGVVACFTDYTDQREQRRMLDVAIEAARIAPWHWNLVDDVARFDSRAARAFGLRLEGPRGGLQQLSLWGAMHRDDVARVRKLLHTHQRQPLPTLQAEFRLPGADGGWRWVMAAGATAERSREGCITAMSGVLIDIDERKRAEAALQRAATTDALTGLPNRALLGERLQQALRSARRHGHCGALLFIDLDHFKRINDVYGHMAGDRVLRAVGERLQALLRADDTLARMGGDELMVLLPEMGNSIEAAAPGAECVGQKLLQALTRPFLLDGTEYVLGASVGCTLFPKNCHESAEDLIREADTAMYAAKAAGRGMLRRFEHAMQRGAAERLALERDLRLALEQQEFSYALQGKWQLVEDGSGKPQPQLAGAELLLRWQHPQRGPMNPALFIPVAEESTLILAIGRWVIEQACALQARWQAEGRPLPLAVNVSPRQFREPGFADELLAITRTHGVAPALLTLEITEGVLLDEGVAPRLEQLAAEGFRFSIDDFGTGYSSLMYLKKLPVHELKIDRAFVRDLTTDPEDAAIVSAMLAIARSFRLDVVAEGVETAEQAAQLHSQGCGLMQGYLFGRPLPVAEFEARRDAP